ncbi:MAG: DUF86 domain-containing protein [Candidatus Pacebacteria bacterium]|nr:DUF86 domain-containing protein [Candidatus Paceibacterota bacterium]
MVADAEIIREREQRIRRYLKDLELFGDISLEDFRRNRERQYAVLHALQLAIEAAIEVATHICSADALGVPSTYADTFRLLGDAAILPSDLTARLQLMAQFRNRIVHLYWDVDLDQVYAILQDRLDDFESFLQRIEAYLSGS